jgi:hypothetical protein
MKQQESHPWAEIPILDLKPLNFKKLPPPPDDSRVVAYQALIKSPEPGMPMYSLTVTAASPGDDQQAERELQSLLSNMRAALLVTAGGPVQDPPDDPEPFNPDTEIEIKTELVAQGTTERTFGVIMVLQTAVDSGPETEAEAEAEAEADLAAPAAAPSSYYTAPKNKRHKFTANHRMYATVTATGGAGSLQPPGGSVSAGYCTSTNKKQRTVYVRGNPYLQFDITLGWTDRGLV